MGGGELIWIDEWGIGGRLSGPEQELTDGHLPTDLEF